LTIIVDVANVMGARADGWWQDRAGAALRLCREVGTLAGRGLDPGELPFPGLAMLDAGESPAAGVAGSPGPGPLAQRCYPTWVLVLEGRARGAADSLPLVAAEENTTGGSAYRQTVAGSDGLVQVMLAPGSGDDAIAREAAELGGYRLVSTADRELRRRCEQAGAVVAGPRWLLRLL
jgi:hypothetical protein